MGNNCVYLTIYKGNKLPMFYIGSSTVDKVNNGYHGSVCSKKYKSIWKNEIKNNPDLFITKILKIFNDRKSASLYEESLQRKLNVVVSPMYINEGYCSTNFTDPNIPPWNKGLTKEKDDRVKKYSETLKTVDRSNFKPKNEAYILELKNRMLNDNPSKKDDVKLKLSAASKGENNAMFGRTGEKSPRFGVKHTKDSIELMKQNRKPRILTEEELNKLRERSSSSKWYHNPETGETSFVIPGNEREGFIIGRGSRSRKKVI